MRKFIYFTFLIFIFIKLHNAASILGIVPTSSYSHQIPFRKIWKELSLRGHQVVVVTTDPMNNASLKNLTEIDMHSIYNLVIELDLENKFSTNDNNPFTHVKLWHEYVRAASERHLSHPNFEPLLSGKYHFDVVIIEAFFSEFFAFGELYNCPIIGIQSLDAHASIHKVMGNTYHPILHPEFQVTFHGPLSFMERLEITLIYLLTDVLQSFSEYSFKNHIIKKYFPNNTLSYEELLNRIDLLLLNVNPVLTDVRLTAPNTIFIGGGMHINEAKPLPKDLQKYLDDANEGVIYFSLGTNVKSRSLGSNKLNHILETFKELPYKVIWKLESDSVLNVPDNVNLLKWAPQQDILRHPNVKLFITQGGMQSIEESIYAHVPMVAIPFFGDQGRNSKRLEYKQIGVMVEPKYLTKLVLLNAIFEVINNSIYRENIVKLAKLSLDEPMNGVEKAVWWIEYVIRNKGAKHFKYPPWEIPLYQYYFLDVILTCLITVLIVLFAFVYVFKCLLCYYKDNNVKLKKN